MPNDLPMEVGGCTPGTSARSLPALLDQQTRDTIHAVAFGAPRLEMYSPIGPPELKIRRRHGIRIGAVWPT